MYNCKSLISELMQGKEIRQKNGLGTLPFFFPLTLVNQSLSVVQLQRCMHCHRQPLASPHGRHKSAAVRGAYVRARVHLQGPQLCVYLASPHTYRGMCHIALRYKCHSAESCELSRKRANIHATNVFTLQKVGAFIACYRN